MEVCGLPRFDGDAVSAFEGWWRVIVTEGQRVDEFQSLTIASIEAFAEDANGWDIVTTYLEDSSQLFGQLSFRQFDGCSEICDSQRHVRQSNREKSVWQWQVSGKPPIR